MYRLPSDWLFLSSEYPKGSLHEYLSCCHLHNVVVISCSHYTVMESEGPCTVAHHLIPGLFWHPAVACVYECLREATGYHAPPRLWDAKHALLGEHDTFLHIFRCCNKLACTLFCEHPRSCLFFLISQTRLTHDSRRLRLRSILPSNQYPT